MSSSSSSASTGEISTIDHINYTGGFPSSADFAPCVLFLILYVLVAIPLVSFRLIKRESRTWMLLRPTVFIGARIGMLITRAIMAKGTYSIGLFIAELTLVSIGFLFLIEPIIALWRRHLASAVPNDQLPWWCNRLAVLLRLCLLAAIGTAIAGGALTSSAFDSASGIATVRSLSQASYCLSLVVVVIAVLALVLTHFSFGLDATRTVYILAPATCLFIVAIYRVVQKFTTDASAPVNSIAAFWILQITFEFFAMLFLLAINLNEWYPSVGASSANLKNARPSNATSEAEMGEMPRGSRSGLASGWRRN